MGASTTVMGAAAHHSPCSLVATIGQQFRGLVAAGRYSHWAEIQLRNGGISAGEVRCILKASYKLRISPEVQVVNKECCNFLGKQSSAASVFSPKQEHNSTDDQRKYSVVTASAKRSRQKPDSKKSQRASLGAGLTREEQENVLELLSDSGLNGNWLYKDDEFDDLDDAPFLDAVVKVYTTRSEPNFSLPWQKMRQYSVTGSGFMISGRRLLTNAHCVEHHTQVKVKRRGIDTKFVATVLAVGRECDIALLSVQDEEFWVDVEPLEFGGLPRLQDPVTVVGYPIGGETISVTSGVVSRVEITSYAHGATELLAVQIDAAINPGNSGGPAFDEDGECVGIAFQSIDASDAENIGYVIPTPVIKHFLFDYERNGKNTGFPSCGLVWQRLENIALRAALQMTNNQKGVLIRRVEPTSPASLVLKAGDVLMKFDGVPVANEGTVPFQAGERIAFTFLASQKYSGDVVEVEVLRGGEVMTLQTALKAPTRLVPVHIDGKLPSYLIVAGLVFTVVSQPFLESHFGMDYDSNIPVKILEKATYGMAQFEDEQLVVVSQVLASDVNVGYEDIEAAQVLSFNGTKIRNLRQLAQLADSCEDRYIQIELDNEMLVVLETEQARTAIPQILRDHCIPADRSEDLLAASS